jgi:hypothetical protein
MKTLEQALQELKSPDESNYELNLKQQAFKQGVKFAQEWMPAEKELPKERQSVIVRFDIRRDDLYGLTTGHVTAGVWHLQSYGNYCNPRVIDWRPLKRD